MVDDDSSDENDSLRLQNLGGGVSCVYYTGLIDPGLAFLWAFSLSCPVLAITLEL